MASKHGATATTQSHQNAHKAQAYEKLQEKQHTETGVEIKCDLAELREDPQKAERWLTQREEPPEIKNHTTAAEDWGGGKNAIHQTLETISQRKQERGKKPSTRMGKSEIMEHQGRMGKNAAEYRRKKPDTKTNNENGPNKPTTTAKK